MLCRRLLMLKPMQPAVSGYARLQTEGGRTDIQIHLRGLPGGGARFFWYAGAGETRELGQAPASMHGEACLTALLPADTLSPRGLQALLVLTDEASPKPLLIGLSAQQSAGSLLDARNAAMALCEKLARPSRPEARAPEPKPALPPAKPAPPKGREAAPLPREIFLPAIDPSPYTTAREPVQKKAPAAALPAKPYADRLRPLRWPKGFEPLRRYFARAKPCALFDLPGWRFVPAGEEDGRLWVGMQAVDGSVRRVAYAYLGDTPPAEHFRPMRGLDGRWYQVLWQRAES